MASHVRATTRFAEILSDTGQRIYIGVIMAAGSDWVEVSIAPTLDLPQLVYLRFVPDKIMHAVKPSWHKPDRVGFTYQLGGPPEDHFAGISGLYDARPASMKLGSAS